MKKEYKSVRLSNVDKRDIENMIVNNSKPRQLLLKHREHNDAMIIKLRDFSLGKHKDAYLALPAKLQKLNNFMLLNAVPGHGHTRIDTSNNIPAPVTRLLFEDLNKTLQKQLVNYLDKESHLEDEVSTYREKVKSLLFSVNSTKQLLEQWPDAIEHLPAYIINQMQGTAIVAVDNTLIKDIKKGLQTSKAA